MKVTQQSRRQVRLQNALFVVLFLGLIGITGWLTQAFSYQADWTAGNRNTLSETTQRLLQNIEDPVDLTVFTVDDRELRQTIRERIEKYQRFKPNITLQFVNPDLDPQRAAAEGIKASGQVVIRIGDRREVIENLREPTVANALQRLVRDEQRMVVFIEGHEERSPFDESNRGLLQLAESLKRSGIRVQELSLVRAPQIPSGTALVVLASPQRTLLPGEVDALRSYVREGGNLLWLQDPDELRGLQPLAQDLGIGFLQGIVVDANADLRLLIGIDNPAVIPVIDYRVHPITKGLEVTTLFPLAWGVGVSGEGGPWKAEPIAASLNRTWLETGDLNAPVGFDQQQGDILGPITLGMALTREVGGADATAEADASAAHDEAGPREDGTREAGDQKTRQQRVVVFGDGDFMGNAYLGWGGNLQLATNIFNWLAEDEELISITPKSAPDTQLNLTETSAAVIGIGFLGVLPLGLLGAGIVIWLKRRKR